MATLVLPGQNVGTWVNLNHTVMFSVDWNTTPFAPCYVKGHLWSATGVNLWLA